MYFKEIKPGHYSGSVEPGNKCLIPRKGIVTYLISKVEFNDYEWIGLDQGFDIETNEQMWGSQNGALHFKKLVSLGEHLDQNWTEGSI